MAGLLSIEVGIVLAQEAVGMTELQSNPAEAQIKNLRELGWSETAIRLSMGTKLMRMAVEEIVEGKNQEEIEKVEGE